MSSHFRTIVSRNGPLALLSPEHAATPILIGAATGLATGATIWIMVVIRFGIPGWFWP